MREGLLDYYDERGATIIARQQLSPVYHRNGVAYTITRAALLKEDGALLAPKTGAVVIGEPLVNIDGPMDLELAEFMSKRSRLKKRAELKGVATK